MDDSQLTTSLGNILNTTSVSRSHQLYWLRAVIVSHSSADERSRREPTHFELSCQPSSACSKLASSVVRATTARLLYRSIGLYSHRGADINRLRLMIMNGERTFPPVTQINGDDKYFLLTCIFALFSTNNEYHIYHQSYITATRVFWVNMTSWYCSRLRLSLSLLQHEVIFT